MSKTRQTSQTRSRLTLTACLAILGLGAIPARATSPLHFFKNFFITGDYLVGGIGLQGQGRPDPATASIVGGTNSSYATGTISVSGVPAGADLVGAFLYWEALESSSMPSSTGGTFRGFKIIGLPIAPASTPSCVSSGGSTLTLRVYRADVLRFLPFVQDATGKPLSQRFVNDSDLTTNGFPLTKVALPDGSNGTLVPGATLVVMYRIASALIYPCSF